MEYQISHIGGKHVPLEELSERIFELEPYRKDKIVVMCKSGKRSAQAVHYLTKKGFNAFNLTGGITAWAHLFDSSMPIGSPYLS